ncbi:hypothetical protein R1sor_025953 [Riccia sorocarpa]|uniref:Lipoxygenase domain-containing protein n=1 Tax=Riccia sorocarpa TaxID=122646 RepID=A0ABD3GA35_9MARC
MSAVAFGATWQFDLQALPQDLIARGMAEPADDTHPGGVKLVVEDYPFAKDGLELWDGIKSWIAKYVSIVYNDSDKAVQADTELQSWWKELVNVGFEDVKSAPWWPKLDSCKSLVDILTTISWIAGPHHAAVNFGQYAYAGFMPNKPSMTRKFIPEKGSPEYGQIDERVKSAFAEFTKDMKDLERRINERNADPGLKNRQGPSRIPYKLLFPTSSSGLTGQGVPYSTSI